MNAPFIENLQYANWSSEIFAQGSGRTAIFFGFLPQPEWVRENRDYSNLRDGLLRVGLPQDDIDGIMGGNWHRFFAENFGPA